MRKSLFCLILSLISYATLSSQTFISPVSGATLIGSFPIGLRLYSDANGVVRYTTAAADTSVATLIWIMSVGSGKKIYVVSSDSIRWKDNNSSLINIVPTPQLFSFLEKAAVEKGTALGYTAPSSGCDSVASYANACVDRSGSGITTHFTPCDRYEFSARAYSICASTGGPTITQIASPGTSCNSGSECEPTNPPSSGGGSYIQ